MPSTLTERSVSGKQGELYSEKATESRDRQRGRAQRMSQLHIHKPLGNRINLLPDSQRDCHSYETSLRNKDFILGLRYLSCTLSTLKVLTRRKTSKAAKPTAQITSHNYVTGWTADISSQTTMPLKSKRKSYLLLVKLINRGIHTLWIQKS